jgi:sugar O-acyltransferase (sialic acid O-acetyltransferase NeuD family)
MATPLLILGTGAFAEEVATVVGAGDSYELAGFVENLDRHRTTTELLGLPVHWIDDAAGFAATHEVVCALGTTKRRGFISQATAAGFRFASVRHPTAVVASNAEICPGTILGAGVIVAARSRVGSYSILNRGVLIGHHTQIGECVTVSPGANIAGRVKIEGRAYVGMGAIVVEDRTIGGGSIVGAGAVVTRDVAAGTQVQGVPAQVARERVEPR